METATASTQHDLNWRTIIRKGEIPKEAFYTIPDLSILRIGRYESSYSQSRSARADFSLNECPWLQP